MHMVLQDGKTMRSSVPCLEWPQLQSYYDCQSPGGSQMRRLASDDLKHYINYIFYIPVYLYRYILYK
jgi:hypothetical protein